MKRKTKFEPVTHSLASLLGDQYADAVAAARSCLSGQNEASLRRLTRKTVQFFPPAFQRSLLALLGDVGRRVCPPLRKDEPGAASRMFAAASHLEMAPLCGYGYYRLGQDGRLFLITKSEHYHSPLGHSFQGYQLIDFARQLGIPNATHNNTRGYITRLLERQLVGAAAGIELNDSPTLDRLVRSKARTALNRVINMETGSLVCEAAIKMMLARFYKVQPTAAKPKYAGRTPVFVVMGDDDGGPGGNYHGTTVLAQTMRGMWGEVLEQSQRQGIFQVASVRPNRIDDVEDIFARMDRGRFKIAGFLHELVMMNYGGRRLDRKFIRRAYELCRLHDVPTLVDEIQTCLWSPVLFAFREYGLRPSFVTVGKGLPGGEYAASRVIFNNQMDLLPQFGALVTNGQEELASLAYLITMEWARCNTDVTAAVGEYYEERLGELVDRHRDILQAVQGRRHLASLRFGELETCKRFVADLTRRGFDISVHTYKATCAPSALTKLPLIAGYEVVDLFVGKMEESLAACKA